MRTSRRQLAAREQHAAPYYYLEGLMLLLRTTVLRESITLYPFTITLEEQLNISTVEIIPSEEQLN